MLLQRTKQQAQTRIDLHRISDAISRFFGKVPVTLFIHRGSGRAEAPFSRTPDFSMKCSVPSSDFENWGAHNSLAIHEDLTGDGVAELAHLGPRL